MTKSEFFEIITDHLKGLNGEFNAFGEYIAFEVPRYSAADLEPYEFHEDPENYAKWKAENPDYPWVAHASGYTVKNCWLVGIIHHRTHDAATKQAKIFTRWIAEYKELNK